MPPRHHRKGLGFWLAAGALFLMQAGVHGEVATRVAGPSQGVIPAAFTGGAVLIAANGPSGARGFSPEAGTGNTAQDGGSRPAPVGDRHAPLDSNAASTAPGGGGGGGGRSAVVPVLRGNPDGVDAVSGGASPSPSPMGGGGGGGPATDGGPFIRILPGGDAADWTRSPTPSSR